MEVHARQLAPRRLRPALVVRLHYVPPSSEGAAVICPETLEPCFRSSCRTSGCYFDRDPDLAADAYRDLDRFEADDEERVRLGMMDEDE